MGLLGDNDKNFVGSTNIMQKTEYVLDRCESLMQIPQIIIDLGQLAREIRNVFAVCKSKTVKARDECAHIAVLVEWPGRKMSSIR